jgi:hypothetical protein
LWRAISVNTLPDHRCRALDVWFRSAKANSEKAVAGYKLSTRPPDGCLSPNRIATRHVAEKNPSHPIRTKARKTWPMANERVSLDAAIDDLPMT